MSSSSLFLASYFALRHAHPVGSFQKSVSKALLRWPAAHSESSSLAAGYPILQLLCGFYPCGRFFSFREFRGVSYELLNLEFFAV